MADKFKRVNNIIKKDLTNIIIYEMKSPVTNFASINDVKLSVDYSYATVYVSHLERNKIDDLVAYLNNHAGIIRSKLSKQLDIYKTPELRFVADTFTLEADSLTKKIEEAVNKKPVTLEDVYGKDDKKD